MAEPPPIDPRRRPESFDTVAAYYERYRRGYPREVIDDVIASAGIDADSRVLEIAPGTGQLSVPIAETGAELVCVELGPTLAAAARRNLAPWPRARVENSAFEAWPLPDRSFDAVLCATAFHWLEPKARVEKTARALRPGGTLVVVQSHHVLGGTAGFSEESQEFYLKWGLSEEPTFSRPTPDELPVMYDDLGAGLEYDDVERHRHTKLLHFTTDELVGLFRTDSLVLGLDERAREGFLGDIRRFMDDRLGGEVAKQFLYEVIVARRSVASLL